MTGEELAKVALEAYERVDQLRLDLNRQGIDCKVRIIVNIALPSGGEIHMEGP